MTQTVMQEYRSITLNLCPAAKLVRRPCEGGGYTYTIVNGAEEIVNEYSPTAAWREASAVLSRDR